MTKIAIVGDIHVKERPHNIRKDDFLTTALGKIEYLLQRYDKVICLGDLFEKYENSDYLFYRIYKLFSKYPKKFITIPGNHDIMSRNHEDISRTTIGILALTEVIDLKMKSFEIDGVKFAVSLVDKSNFNEIPIDTENENVLLGHNYYEQGISEETITREEIKKLGYKFCYFGHDHQEYVEDYISGYNDNDHIVIRMGSLTRKDAQHYNQNRTIHYYEFDTETREYEKKELPTLHDSEVFIDNAFNRKIIKSEIDFVKIADVLEKFKKAQTGKVSLYEKLVQIRTPERYIKDIKLMHENNGVPFF